MNGDRILTDGDTGFVGVNCRLDPSQLGPGFVSEAVNRMFDRGIIRNRWGVVRPQWGAVSVRQSVDMTGAAGNPEVVLSLPAPMDYASIASPYLRGGTIVLSKAADNVTVDSTTITVDDTEITVDSTGYTVLSNAPTSNMSSVAGYMSDNSVQFSGPIVGCGTFSDPDSGANVILVCVDEERSDGGQGAVYALQPGYVAQAIDMNGHDINGTVRFVQAFNGVVMLRQNRARFYFNGDDVDTDVITLHVPAPFITGTRVTFRRVGDAAPLGSLLDGNNYFAHVDGSDITLYPTENDAEDETNGFALDAGAAGDRYILEQNDPWDVIDNPDRNSGLPLICQATASVREALLVGFDSVPTALSITAGDEDLDTATAENHRLLSGDLIVLTGSSGGGVAGDTYYAHVVDPNTIKLYAETDQVDALSGGGTPVDITGTFTASIRKTGAYGVPISPGREGIYFANRLWMVYGADLLMVSDILDPLHYSPLSSEFRINSGSDDRIVALAPFNETSIVIFKERSILMLQGCYGDLSSITLSEITRQFGCIAPLSVASTGSDLVFLSQRGVATVRQTAEGIAQSVVEPLSESVQDYIDRILWSDVGEACGTYFGNRYLLAVPVEDDTMVLSYNFLNKAWEGMWEGGLLKPTQFLLAQVSGQPSLLFMDKSQWVHEFDSGAAVDRENTGEEHIIETEVLTRGYTFRDWHHKTFSQLGLELATLNPNYTANAILDGVGEEVSLITGQTRDRTKYFTFGAGAYDATNSGDNFLRPYRQDYSLRPGFYCGSGVAVGRKQRALHKLRVGRRSGASVQLQLITTQGSVDLLSVTGEAIGLKTDGHEDN
jgi:hypothetical protein